MQDDASKTKLEGIIKVYISRKEKDKKEMKLCRRKEWNLGNLKPQFSSYLPNYPSLTLQA